MQKAVKKSISILLSLFMVFSVVSVAGVAFLTEAEAQTPAAGETTTVVACSDYQHPNDNRYNVGATGNAGGAIVVGDIVNKMQSDGISDIDGFLCAGDYDYDNNGDVASGIASLTNAVAPITDDDTYSVFVQGNHDPQSTAGGTSPSGDNDPESGAYGVFVINERDYQYGGLNHTNETATLELMETLRRYFNHKIAVNYTAPIFVISHVPLHFSMRTKDEGDNIYAKDIFDVLNEAGGQGLNIIYLYGHNHGKSWDDYLGGSKVFLRRGDSINIAELGSRTAYTSETLNFVYMNAGFTGYYENWNTASGANSSATYSRDDLTMTSFQITDSTVTINRYNNSGVTELKKAGIPNYYKNEQNFTPAYSPNETEISSYTMNLTEAVEDTEYEIDPVIEADPDVLAGMKKMYSRITSLDQLVDGGTYLLICTTTFQNNYNNPVNTNMNFFLTHDIVGTQGSNHGLGRASVPSGFSHSDTSIEGAYGAYEWTFNKSGNAWTISTGGQGITFVRSGNNGAYNVELSNSGTAFTFSKPRTNVNEFLPQASLNNQTVFFDANKDLNYTYAYAGSYNRATFAIYGTKLIPGGNSQVYRREDVSSNSSLVNNATYLVVCDGRAISSAQIHATPVPIETVSGAQIIAQSSPTLEWTWARPRNNSNNYNLRSNQSNNWMQLLVNNSGYTYELADSLEDGETYVIVTQSGNSDYAMTGTSNKNDIWEAELYSQSVTRSGNTITANDYSTIEWVCSPLGNGVYNFSRESNKLCLRSGPTVYVANDADYSKLTVNFSNDTATIMRAGNSSNYYLSFNASNSHFVCSTDANAVAAVRFYKKTASDATYGLSIGSDTTQYLTVTGNGDGTAKIRVNGGGSSKYVSLDTSVYDYTVSDTGSDFEFYRQVTMAMPDTIVDVTVVPGQSEVIGEYSNISIYPEDGEGTVYVGANGRTYTGLYFNITHNGTRDVTQVPIKVSDLIDYTGHQNVADYCNTPGDYTGLGAYYSPTDGAWLSSIILHVIQKEDYPEYPNEGSVKVNKTSGSPNFLTNGVTQIELTATGVPMSPGVDIVLMLDTSSSMSETVNGVTRMDALRDSVGVLIDTLAKPNETTGLMPDITMAIADFNGYYDPTDGQQSYVSSTDTADGSMVYTSSNSTYHSHVLTGPYAGSEATNTIFDNSAFIDIADLKRDFDPQGIRQYAGTNYDAAFQTIYKLFEARQDYNAANQEERETVVIFMSDGGPFQYNFFSAQSTSDLWNDWQIGTYDDTTAQGLANLQRDFPSDRWYFYNGLGNSNRFADAVKGDPDRMYTIPTKDPTAYCGDRNSDGLCDFCGRCIASCVDEDHDGLCDVCGHLDQCAHTDANHDGYCDVANCGACINGCDHYQYMTQVPGLGASMYSIVFCPAVNQNITLESLEHVIESVASSEDMVYSAYTPDDLTDAFLDIASKFVQAGTNAYFTDIMGAAYDLQTATVYTKNSGEFERTYTLDPRPTIEVKKHTVYTRADYENGVINDFNLIGTRTGQSTTIEVVSFSDDGTQGYSNQINNGNTNIYVDGIINAKYFTYNNTSTPIMIDTDGDGVDDYSLSSETFYWKIGIIENTEYALTYWLYLTGSMEGERDPGSFPTNQAAILWYDNYLDHPCYLETYSPVQAWEAATVTYEYYLVNELGQPVNSSGEVVPFANRVLIGNQICETFHLNDNEGAQASFHVPVDQLPEGYRLYNPDASFVVALYSGDDYNTSVARIDDDADVCTTYYYGSRGTWNQNGDVPGNLVDDYANTHVAFGIMFQLSIIPDTVVIDYGLPVKIHVLQNDLALNRSTRINAIGTGLMDSTELSHGYGESRLINKGQALTLNHGTVDVVNGDSIAETYLTYTPTDMQMSAEDVCYYEVYQNNIYYYAKVTVIPAANIYYEDSFLTFTGGTGENAAYQWQTAGETYQNVFQAEDRPGIFSLTAYDANNVYGNDAAYDDEVATYSLGSSKYITVDSGCKVTTSISPKATFTFCGTGFDVISTTCGDTGVMAVTYKNLETGVTKNQIINTYYGYSYGQLYLNRLGKVTLDPTDDLGNENMKLYYFSHTFDNYTPNKDPDEYLVRVNGRVYSTKDHSGLDDTEYDVAYGWLAESSANSLYQIPVIKIKGLNYGTYEVTILPRYSSLSSFDVQGRGYYSVYVDGIRIYNPAGTGDNLTEVVAEAYEDDYERNPVFAEVRDTVIADPENFLKQTAGIGENAQTVGGSIMVDGMSVTAGSASALADMVQSGPNNEMYLAQYQAIAFKPTVVSDKAPASFQLGMKVAITRADTEDGPLNPSVSHVRVIISDVKKQAIKQIYSMAVSGSAEQFYDLSPLLSWTKSEDSDTYVCDYDIVILNDSNVVLSLTTFKVTFSSREDAVTRSIELMSNRNTLAFAAKAVNKVLTSADDSTMEIQWNSTDFAVGAQAVLTVTTSDEITSVMIGDTEVTDYKQNDDGTRTFTLEFVVQDNGDNTFGITLKDAFGRVSETFTANIPLAEDTSAETDEPTDVTEAPDDDTSGSTRFAGLRRLIDWLLNFFRKIVNFFKIK